MKVIYKVHENYSPDGMGNYDTVIGYFVNKDDADEAAKDKGNYTGNAKIKPVELFESINDYNKNNKEEIRRNALSKLNDVEKKILGLL